MTEERSLKIVCNHRPSEVPPEVAPAALTGTVAVVLSTFRSDSPDMVLDHRLWLACMKAVGGTVLADTTEVYAEPEPRFLGRFRARRKGPSLGSLDSYGRRLLSDPSAPEWQFVFWRKGEQLVAAAACEPWHRIGGPLPYHDSYTTCVFVDVAVAQELARVLDRTARHEGVRVEEMVGYSDPGAA